MPFSFLALSTYLQINGDRIELIHEGQLLMSMTAEEARSNAADLIEVADRLEGKGAYKAG
jgi:hypothetical protein